MYIPLPTPKEMGLWDKITIEHVGILGEILMENASWQVVYAIQDDFPNLKHKKVAIIAGPGNNGGDGFAVARHLSNLGADVKIFYKKDLESYKKDAAYHVNLTLKMGISTEKIPETDFNLCGYDIIVDALLGTGFSGQLRDDYKRVVEAINRAKPSSYILSVDIPSGLNGYIGIPSPIAVKANVTVTFEEAKVGLYLPEAKEFVGKLVIGKIGIPQKIKQENPPSFYGISTDIIKYLPDITHLAHKGSASHVLVIGGAKGLTGAVSLCSLAALKAGAGLVTAAIPCGCSSNVKLNWPEIMTKELGSRNNTEFEKEHFNEIKDDLSKFDAVVIGPGMGRNNGAREFLRQYLNADHPPTVIDADALYNLSKLEEDIKIPSETILTPHPGEAAYLLNTTTAKIQQDRFNAVKTLVHKYGCVCVLKGAGTLVSDIDKKIYISNIACKNLAIGGSGDVLSGIIGYLKGMKIDSKDAACMGVMWHGVCGVHLEKEYPYRGNLAQDIAFTLPLVR